VDYYTYIKTSSDTGATWVDRMTDANRLWRSVSMSSSGQYQIAAASSSSSNGYIYTSNDFGNTWVAKITDTNRAWTSVSMSSTGQYQTATVYNTLSGGYIYTSSNTGATWVVRTSTGSSGWYGVSISSAGDYITAVADGNNIYTSKTTINITLFTFNLDNGTTFFLTGQSPTENYSVNFTISTLNTANTYLITVINKTSSVASFYCNAVQINGTGRTLLYTGSRVVTGASQTNQEFIMFYNTTTSVWVVLTNIKVFKA
jgi:hypothetical protein